MKEREYVLALYEIYNKLLTEREREYFEYYFFEDYSLQEIALNFKVSTASVGKLINAIENKLLKFEEALNINYKNVKIKEIISNIDKKTANKIEELL